ncbi:MAG: exodeoxyribonuclease VII small subunit [Oscillospiraceae bacterium]
MKKGMTFEKAMNRLEEIARLIEAEDITLDQSIILAKESAELVVFCNEKIDTAELEIKQILIPNS